MTDDFYQRSVKLQLGTKSFQSLRIAFRIEKSLKPRPNQAEVRIWNLSEDTRKLFDDDVYVALEAGYGANLASIFVGNLDRVDHVRQGPDWMTSVRVGDGKKEIKRARVNTSFRPGTTPGQIMQAMVGSMTDILSTKGFDIKIAAGNAITQAKKGDTKGAFQTLSQGFVALGGAFDQIVQLGNNMGYDVSIQDKQITLLAPGDTDGQKDIYLSPESGLVGSPELAEKEHVKCRALLNGNLRPGRGVLLKSQQFNGRYRIEKCVMQGDTHGTEWFVDLELRKLG